MSDNIKIYDKVGGRPTLEKVHKIFYDKVYEHPWMKKFFEGIDQKHIEDQQSDFLSKALGGPNIYSGALPVAAHKHMMVTEELFELRHQMLKESLIEVGVDEESMKYWLNIDKSFKDAIVKKSTGDLQKRFFTDEFVIHPNPEDKKAA